MFLLRSIWSVGSKRLDSLSDYSRHHYRLRADCLRCKRVTVLDPLPLIERCQAKGWSYQIGAVAARLVCAECGSREVRLGLGFEDQSHGFNRSNDMGANKE